jgi:hypothetical protein
VVSSSKSRNDASHIDPRRESPGTTGPAAAGTASALSRELDLEDALDENRRLLSALKQLREENLDLNRALNQSAMPEELHQFHLLVEDQSKRLDLMQASLSWRITAPLRLLARLLGAA